LKCDSEQKKLTFFTRLNLDFLLGLGTLLNLKVATEPMAEGLTKNVFRLCRRILTFQVPAKRTWNLEILQTQTFISN
jgi:hypothetical protein